MDTCGAEDATLVDVKGKIFEFAWWMKKQGYAETTIITRTKILKILVKRGANLFGPESVKEAIAKQEGCNKRKVNAADAYTCFLRIHNLTWDPPRYKVARNLPSIPTEMEIHQLIAGCSNKSTPLLQLLKETEMRIGEVSKLKWTDVDPENVTIRVTLEKACMHDTPTQLFLQLFQLVFQLPSLGLLRLFAHPRASRFFSGYFFIIFHRFACH